MADVALLFIKFHEKANNFSLAQISLVYLINFWKERGAIKALPQIQILFLKYHQCYDLMMNENGKKRSIRSKSE